MLQNRMKSPAVTAGSNQRLFFTIVDDTDHATVERVKPVYDLLAELGLRTTKTVWPLRCENPASQYAETETLEHPPYASWISHLQAEGFEIAWHGAAGDSSVREKTLRGLDRFERVLGTRPIMHVNHSQNRDSLYWRTVRFESSVVRFVVAAGGRG